MSSFGAHTLVSTLRSRLLTGGVVAGKRQMPYILDFNGQCPATDSTTHHEKKLRNHPSCVSR
jgi:hypothetical protein